MNKWNKWYVYVIVAFFISAQVFSFFMHKLDVNSLNNYYLQIWHIFHKNEITFMGIKIPVGRDVYPNPYPSPYGDLMQLTGKNINEESYRISVVKSMPMKKILNLPKGIHFLRGYVTPDKSNIIEEDKFCITKLEKIENKNKVWITVFLKDLHLSFDFMGDKKYLYKFLDFIKNTVAINSLPPMGDDFEKKFNEFLLIGSQ